MTNGLLKKVVVALGVIVLALIIALIVTLLSVNGFLGARLSKNPNDAIVGHCVIDKTKYPNDSSADVSMQFTRAGKVKIELSNFPLETIGSSRGQPIYEDMVVEGYYEYEVEERYITIELTNFDGDDGKLSGQLSISGDTLTMIENYSRNSLSNSFDYMAEVGTYDGELKRFSNRDGLKFTKK
ncbi:hypothetical protein FACS189490_01790 [Clostridia bacterium]|nr:hypothetical protein FACS189490_01790 [Clostridia bacterium]